MAFPSSPTNGQTAYVNGINYAYNSSKGAWVRVPTTVTALNFQSANISNTTPSTSTISGALVVAGGAGIGGNIYTGGNLNVASGLNTQSPTSGALVVTGGVGIGQDLRVGGNLYVANIISATYQTLTVTDHLLYLSGNITYPYNYDIGFYGHFIGGPANTYVHTGLVRDYSTNSWYLFSNIGEPTGGTMALTGANVIYDPITLGGITTTGTVAPNSNLTANSGSVSNWWNNIWAGTVNASLFNGNGKPLTGLLHYNQASSTPSNPSLGDIWYDTSTDIEFMYINDGTNNVWVDITSVAMNTNVATVQGTTLSILGTGTVSGTFTSGQHTITGSPLTAIVNGGSAGVGNIGSVGQGFNIVYAQSTSAQYADLAERYISDSDYDPGTVVIFGGTKEITISTVSHDTRIAGVISTNPAYLMNDHGPGLPVALQGRVPCRVRGPVAKGDLLVSSATSGVAERVNYKKYKPGCVIGKSLEEITTNEVLTIEVVIGRV